MGSAQCACAREPGPGEYEARPGLAVSPGGGAQVPGHGEPLLLENLPLLIESVVRQLGLEAGLRHGGEVGEVLRDTDPLAGQPRPGSRGRSQLVSLLGSRR